jgi:uncharacterized protein YrzB (UPF0473 family)
MKTTQTKKTKSERKPLASAGLNKSDDALAVLRDASNGKEYFLSIIDSFSVSGRDYVVMYNYEPDDGNHADPELVIMRTEYAKNGDQYFFSIKDKHELDAAFDLFMSRFSSSATQVGY